MVNHNPLRLLHIQLLPCVYVSVLSIDSSLRDAVTYLLSCDVILKYVYHHSLLIDKICPFYFNFRDIRASLEFSFFHRKFT